jgi:transposase, IS5 family
MKKKQTRSEQFLAKMDAVVPWGRHPALIAPHHPRVGPKGGRPPMPLELIQCLARFELRGGCISDETMIRNFRQLLERNELSQAIVADVKGHLADKGITLRSGTQVVATIIDAPSSTENNTASIEYNTGAA